MLLDLVLALYCPGCYFVLDFDWDFVIFILFILILVLIKVLITLILVGFLILIRILVGFSILINILIYFWGFFGCRRTFVLFFSVVASDLTYGTVGRTVLIRVSCLDPISLNKKHYWDGLCLE